MSLQDILLAFQKDLEQEPDFNFEEEEEEEISILDFKDPPKFELESSSSDDGQSSTEESSWEDQQSEWTDEPGDPQASLSRTSKPLRITVPRPSPAEWVHHTVPLLEEYAGRQMRVPLCKRVSITFNHPTQFVLGSSQLLSNSDRDSENSPPALLDAYVDIDRWAKEYLRSQFKQTHVNHLVAVLLTTISNAFYEGFMRLMDSVVERALENKGLRGGSSLEVADFAFGFDFHMSQEIPFLANINHRVHDTLERDMPRVNDGAVPTSGKSLGTHAKIKKRTFGAGSGRSVLKRQPGREAQEAPVQDGAPKSTSRKKGLTTKKQVQDSAEVQVPKTLTRRVGSKKAVPLRQMKKKRVPSIVDTDANDGRPTEGADEGFPGAKSQLVEEISITDPPTGSAPSLLEAIDPSLLASGTVIPRDPNGNKPDSNKKHTTAIVLVSSTSATGSATTPSRPRLKIKITRPAPLLARQDSGCFVPSPLPQSAVENRTWSPFPQCLSDPVGGTVQALTEPSTPVELTDILRPSIFESTPLLSATAPSTDLEGSASSTSLPMLTRSKRRRLNLA